MVPTVPSLPEVSPNVPLEEVRDLGVVTGVVLLPPELDRPLRNRSESEEYLLSAFCKEEESARTQN